MNARTSKLISRYSLMRGISSKIIKRLWNSTPSPSRQLARLKMKSDILRKLNETLTNSDQVSGLHKPSKRETVDGSRY